MNKKAERGQATRDQLVVIATGLFAAHGYDGASIDAVLQEAGVSKGALYHHFKGKEALFEAVFEAVEADIGLRLLESADPGASPEDLLRIGCLTWVRMAVDPVVRQVVLIDAPAVLGWHRWREIEERHGFGALKLGLEAVGRLDPSLVDVFAHMLLAALNETALQIAWSAEPVAQTRIGERAVTELLDRLLETR